MKRTISISTVVCAVLWTIGAALTALAVVNPNRGFGPVGIYVTTIAAVWQIHGFIQGCARRQEDAFRLGEEAGKVRQMRR